MSSYKEEHKVKHAFSQERLRKTRESPTFERKCSTSGLDNTTPYLRPLFAAMRFMHGQCMEDISEPCNTCGLALPDRAPDVPETCIYSKSDGIVEWHSCIEEGPQVECVEVDSGHCGIC